MTEVRTTSSSGGQKGVKLARFDLIPVGPLTALAEHFGRGALKYDDNQWRRGYEWSKSYAAVMRHWTKFWGGEDYDVCPPDDEGCAFVDQHGEPFPAFDTPRGRGCYNHTTSHHVACAAWHSVVMLEFVETHPEHDDRYATQRARTAARLIREFGEKSAPWTSTDLTLALEATEVDIKTMALLYGSAVYTVTLDGEIVTPTEAVNDALNRRD